MYFVYLLETSSGSIYTGSTPNLKQRISEHKSGFCLSTRKLRPVRLIWFCAFPSSLRARRFEKYLKNGSGQAFRNNRLVQNDLSD